jgi:hypothetical protein
MRFFTNLSVRKAVFLIVTFGFIVFGNALFNGFVWDDILQIRDNTNVQSLANFPHFFSSGINSQNVFYRPLMLLSFSAIYTLFGVFKTMKSGPTGPRLDNQKRTQVV